MSDHLSRFKKNRWWCVLLGHKWGGLRAVGDTGEFYQDCDRCAVDSEKVDDEAGFFRNRWETAKAIISDFRDAVLCKLGFHMPGVWEDAPDLCIRCWTTPEERKNKGGAK